jgi:hypothetical protein
MRRIVLPAIAILLASAAVLLVPALAWAGGTGQDSCPTGDTSYSIPDDSTLGLSNAKLLPGGHGWLAPAYLPAGRYRVHAEGDRGPADNPPNAPYLSLCRDSHGKPGQPVLASAQGRAGTIYQVPLAYMLGGVPVASTWLPAGIYRGVTGDSITYGSVQMVAGPPSIAWWRYAILAVGIVVIVVVGVVLPIVRRRTRMRPLRVNTHA